MGFCRRRLGNLLRLCGLVGLAVKSDPMGAERNPRREFGGGRSARLRQLTRLRRGSVGQALGQRLRKRSYSESLEPC